MNRMKKGLALLLSMVMAVIIAPLGVAAEEITIIDSFVCGENLTYILDSTGTLTVSGTGDMYNFDSTSPPWSLLVSNIKSVIIENGVTSIGNNAFGNLKNLTSVSIPNTVKTIGALAFTDCSSLTSVVIPEGVTSIGYNVFYFNEKLSSVTLPSTLTTIGSGAFFYCLSLTNITIPENVTKIESTAFSYSRLSSISIPSATLGDSVFSNCPNLTTVNLLSGVKEISSGAFNGAYKLININVSEDNMYFSSQNGVLYNKDKTSLLSYPRGKTETSFNVPLGVETIGPQAFEFSNLQSISLPGTLKTISQMAFLDCSKLKSISIPNSVTTIGESAFKRCEGLGSVILPENLTVISEGVFTRCTSLSNVDIPEGVTSIDKDAFRSCISLKSITLPSNISYIGDSSFDGSGLISITIPSGVIDRYAFSYCSGLEEVIILADVTQISPLSFYKCEKLTGYTISEENPYLATEGGVLFNKDKTVLIRYKETLTSTSYTIPSSVKEINPYAFYYVNNLTSITIPKGVESIHKSAFAQCASLTSIEIPDSVTTIGEEAFYACTSLKSVTVPNSVTSMGDFAFHNCKKLETVTLQNGLTAINNRMFSGCSNLTDITIPNTVKSIGANAFNGCTNLTSIDIPKSVTRIDENAFTASGLTDITITAATIGENAFYACRKLKTVKISSDVNQIAYNAFVNCPALLSIEVDHDNESYSSVDGTLFNKDKTVLIRYPAALSESKYIIPNGVVEIGDFAFSFSNNLTEVIISETVTDIGSYAFSNCANIETLYIPKNITTIGMYAFSSLSNLKSIVMQSSETTLNTYAISLYGNVLERFDFLSTTPPIFRVNTISNLSNSTSIYVPFGTSDSYKLELRYMRPYQVFNNIHEGYVLNVLNGSGSRIFADSDDKTATITAHPGPSGKIFDTWISDNPDVVFANKNAPTTTFTMPADNVTVTAVYKDASLDESVTLTDPSGITVTLKTDQLPAGVQSENVYLDVKLLEKGSLPATSLTQAIQDDIQSFKVYDIHMLLKADDTPVNFTGTVKVRIPLNGMSTNSKIYYIANDGTVEKVNSSISGGYIEFTVEHFSYYAVVDIKQEQPSAPIKPPVTEKPTDEPQPPESSTGDNEDNPNTGVAFTSLITISLTTLAVLVKARKKK